MFTQYNKGIQYADKIKKKISVQQTAVKRECSKMWVIAQSSSNFV